MGNLALFLCLLLLRGGGGGGGGVQGKFFWRIRFELWAPGEIFSEVLGPRRPTVSELK